MKAATIFPIMLSEGGNKRSVSVENLLGEHFETL